MDTGIGLALRMLVSLGIVLALMALLAAAMRRGWVGKGGGTRTTSRRRPVPIEIVSRQSLGRRSSVVLVRTAGRGLVLGVTDQQVTVLAEVADDALEVPTPAPEPILTAPRTAPTGGDGPVDPKSWKGLLEDLRERTVRRS